MPAKSGVVPVPLSAAENTFLVHDLSRHGVVSLNNPQFHSGVFTGHSAGIPDLSVIS
jgi:hypothetical protein